MNAPQDVLSRDLFVGARVGCAFSTGTSTGYLRIGVIEELTDSYIKVRWELNNELSPKMQYKSQRRWIIL